MNREQWQSHAKACIESRQTKTSYAKEHGLTYHNLLYWTRQYELSLVSDFIPVKVKSQNTLPLGAPDSLGVLEFPNGARLIIQSLELAGLLPSLVEH